MSPAPASLPGLGKPSQHHSVAPAPEAVGHKQPNRKDVAAPTNPSNTSQESLQRNPLSQSSNGIQPSPQSGARKPTSGSHGSLQRPPPPVGSTVPRRQNGGAGAGAAHANLQAGRPPR